MPLSDCCSEEAAASLAEHRDIATCDGCGRLLLAYADERTYRLTVEELESKKATFDTDKRGTLWVVAKKR